MAISNHLPDIDEWAPRDLNKTNEFWRNMAKCNYFATALPTFGLINIDLLPKTLHQCDSLRTLPTEEALIVINLVVAMHMFEMK